MAQSRSFGEYLSTNTIYPYKDDVHSLNQQGDHTKIMEWLGTDGED